MSQSEELFARALKLMPGGVSSPVRAFKAVGGSPVFIRKAEGAHVWDADGNDYIDYLGSWGPMILGHAHPAVVEAVQQAVARGTSYGAPTVGELELAERVARFFPSIERVRFVCSGTEATMSALRLARGYTGRAKVLAKIGELLDKSAASFVISTTIFSEIRDELGKKLQNAIQRGVEVVVITAPFQRVKEEVKVIRNETRAEEYQRTGYIYTIPVVHLAVTHYAGMLSGRRVGAEELAQKRVVAASAIGDPEAFIAQTKATGKMAWWIAPSSALMPVHWGVTKNGGQAEQALDPSVAT